MPRTVEPTIANVEILMARAIEHWVAYKETPVADHLRARKRLVDYRRCLRAAVRLSEHLED